MGFPGRREGGDDGGGVQSLDGSNVELNWRGEMEKNEGESQCRVGASLSKGGEKWRDFRFIYYGGVGPTTYVSLRPYNLKSEPWIDSAQ